MPTATATARRVINLHGKIGAGAGAGLASDTPKACRAARGVTAPNCRNYFLNIVLAACTAGGKARLSRSWSLSGMFCALRARGLFFILVWAASGGGKAGPVMGLRPLLGPPCIPPEAPPGVFQLSRVGEGRAATAAGASSLRSVISLRAAQCQRTLSR